MHNDEINKSIQDRIGQQRINILKGFSEFDGTFEKARVDGEIHPNGKWKWNSSAAKGKGDWRVIPLKDQKNTNKKVAMDFPSGVSISTPDGNGKVIGVSTSSGEGYVMVELENGTKKTFFNTEIKKRTWDEVNPGKKNLQEEDEKDEMTPQTKNSWGMQYKQLDISIVQHNNGYFWISEPKNNSSKYYETKAEALKNAKGVVDKIIKEKESKAKPKSSKPTSSMGMNYDEHIAEMQKQDNIQYLHDSGVKKISTQAYSNSVSLSHKHMDYANELKKK